MNSVSMFIMQVERPPTRDRRPKQITPLNAN
jgi:hypothetical protein